MAFYKDSNFNASEFVNLGDCGYSEDVISGSASTSAKYNAIARIKNGATSEIKIYAGKNPTIDQAASGIGIPKETVEYFWIPVGYKVIVYGGAMNISYFYN